MHTESELAEKLKSQCYLNGKERNPKESAETIHKLGLLYRNKKPEKISLIQSAVLLNAAIVRQPDNVEVVKQDLKLLISDVLLRANAEKKDADLLEFSVNIRNELHDFRQKVENDLALLKPPDESLLAEGKEIERNNKISQVMSIQNFVTEKYVSLMRKINDYCVDIMGQPPCRYALIGMGSIAHKETTPYSDFESAIVLEEGVDDKVVEYFRWCSVLFQLVLACLQESIIKFFAIESLNDPTRPGGDWFHDAFTPCGICSDGFAPQASKHPLGRQKPTEKKSWITELIKPVSEMIKYLESDEDLKNGYHLADVLSKTCFVAGDSDIYDEFSVRSQAQLALNNITYKNKLLKEIEDNLKNFDAMTLLGEYFARQLDVKRLLYRTSTIFVSGLGKYFDANCSSNFDILDELSQKGVITQDESKNLKLAVAISCEARLKTYTRTKGQNDIIQNNLSHKNEVAELEQDLGKACIFDYFKIIDCFIKALKELRAFSQKDCKMLNINFKFTDPLLSARVCMSLSLRDEAIQLFREALEHTESNANFPGSQMTCIIMEQLGMQLLYKNQLTDARYYIEKVVEAKSCMLRGEMPDEQMLRCKRHLGLCLNELGDFKGALEFYREELVIRLQTSLSSGTDLGIADCRHLIGTHSNKMGDYGDAIEQFQLELSIRQAVFDGDSVFGPCCKTLRKGDLQVIMCLLSLGQSMSDFGQSKTALIYFNKGLLMRQRMSYDETADSLIADFYLLMCLCYDDCQQLTLALDYAGKTFQTYKKIPDAEKETTLRLLFSMLGTKLIQTGKYSDALRSFHYELELHEISKPCNNSEMAECLYNIGRCYLVAEDKERALEWFKKTLIARRRFCENEAPSMDVAAALYSVGNCCYLLGKPDHAIEHFQQLKTVSQNITSDSRFADYQQLLVQCLLLSKKYEEAYAEYEDIFHQMPQKADVKTFKFYCEGYQFLGLFDKNNGRYEKALKMFEHEKFYRAGLTINTEKVESLSTCNRNIGICCFKLGRFKQALDHFKYELKML